MKTLDVIITSTTLQNVVSGSRPLVSTICVSFCALLLCFARGRGAKYCDEYDCLSDCITQKPHGWTSPNFLCMFPVAIPWSSLDSIAMRYVLMVLWMTSCFHTMGHWARIKHDVMFSSALGGCTVPVGIKTTTVFERIHQNVVLGQSLLSTIDLPLMNCCIVEYKAWIIGLLYCACTTYEFYLDQPSFLELLQVRPLHQNVMHLFCRSDAFPIV